MTWRKRERDILICIGLIAFLIIPKGICQEDINPMFSFSLDSLKKENDPICEYPLNSPSGHPSIFFQPDDEFVRFEFPGYDEDVPYRSSGFLVIDVEHDNPASTVAVLEFHRRGDTADYRGWIQARVSARIGVLPQLQTRLIFPLSYLDAQKVFLPKNPRQLKGTISGKRMEVREIDKICLRLKNAKSRSFPQHLFIRGVHIYKELPPSLPDIEKPLVDSLGQWALRDWKGKSKSFSELKNEIGDIDRSLKSEEWPAGRSSYMGFSSLRFDSTGFFHTHHDGTRWWLVDPLGYAYLSVAPTGVRAFSHGPVEKNEDLFEWLPQNSGLYNKVYANQRGLKSLSFVSVNLIRLWGEDFLTAWLTYTGNLMKSMGFTSSGNWTDRMFHKESGFPYVYPLSGFPTTKVKLFRDFPDVFDPAFSESATNYARQLENKREDPLMIGYFLGNEPHWAFGEFNLAREMMYKNDQSFTRKKFVQWLAQKYQYDPFALSAAWAYEFHSFGDLLSFIFPHEDDITIKAENDMLEFTSLMVDEYARTICEATRKADPNHLNLGLRFAWISSKACLQTGKYFDVFSLNGYSFPEPPNTNIILEEINKPVIIGEFHFGSIDRGLPATGLKGVKNQAGRGNAYRHYVEQGFSRPEIVGMHYFQWNDQPICGRFDGENYNIGIVDVTNRPYPEMLKRIRKTNLRLFQIAVGQKSPFKRIPKAIPSIYY